jgi:hypothetical protein
MPNHRKPLLAPRLARDGVQQHHPARRVAIPQCLNRGRPHRQRLDLGDQCGHITRRRQLGSHLFAEVSVPLEHHVLTAIERHPLLPAAAPQFMDSPEPLIRQHQFVDPFAKLRR